MLPMVFCCPTPVAILLGIIYVLVGGYKEGKRREQLKREEAVFWANWEEYKKGSDERFEFEMAEKRRLKKKEQEAKNVLWFICNAEKRIKNK